MSKQKESKEIELATQAYLAAGNTVKQLPSCEFSDKEINAKLKEFQKNIKRSDTDELVNNNIGANK